MLTLPSKILGSIKDSFFLTLVGMFFFISACQAVNHMENTEYLTIAKMKNYTLELYKQQGQCAIKLNNAPKGKLLNIPYPCGFVRTSEIMSAQTYYYDGVGQVFVVAGPIEKKLAYNDASGVNFKHKCSNLGQAVIIQESNIFLRKSQKVPLGYCHHLGFDEKDYYGFAYPID